MRSTVRFIDPHAKRTRGDETLKPIGDEVLRIVSRCSFEVLPVYLRTLPKCCLASWLTTPSAWDFEACK